MAAFTTAIQARRQARSRSFRPTWNGAAQVALAVIFIFAGAMKFAMSSEQLSEGGFSADFMRFIGACEFLGGLGMELPSLLRLRWLTPIAAAGLVVIMTGATVVTIADMGAAAAAIPFAVGVMAAFVAVRRRDWLGFA
jgi:hypothetical protein